MPQRLENGPKGCRHRSLPLCIVGNESEVPKEGVNVLAVGDWSGRGAAV